jgi:alkanesulfonate monooxygenase SsuD/methylene tetrahydromethanopterin reductase-like flavin-dependent oxidoreductase (luciferase family)
MTSVQQAFVSLRTGRPGRLAPPVEGYERGLGPLERGILDEALSISFLGTPKDVIKGLDAFIARTGADELLVVSQIFDHAARLGSYERIAPGR